MRSDLPPVPDRPTAPAWLVGLWQRHEMLLPDGTADRTTRVFWGQTRSLYVDLRVPADRPTGEGRSRWRTTRRASCCTWPSRRALRATSTSRAAFAAGRDTSTTGPAMAGPTRAISGSTATRSMRRAIPVRCSAAPTGKPMSASPGASAVPSRCGAPPMAANAMASWSCSMTASSVRAPGGLPCRRPKR